MTGEAYCAAVHDVRSLDGDRGELSCATSTGRVPNLLDQHFFVATLLMTGRLATAGHRRHSRMRFTGK